MKGITMNKLKSNILKQQFVVDMELAGLAVSSRRIYLDSVENLIRYFWCSPKDLTEQQVNEYLIEFELDFTNQQITIFGTNIGQSGTRQNGGSWSAELPDPATIANSGAVSLCALDGTMIFDNIQITATCTDVWALGQGMIADLNQDCYIDFADFILLANEWARCIDPQGVDGCEQIQD